MRTSRSFFMKVNMVSSALCRTNSVGLKRWSAETVFSCFGLQDLPGEEQ